MATIQTILAGDSANAGRLKINSNFQGVNDDLSTHDVNLTQLNTRIDDVEIVIGDLEYVSEFGGTINGDLTVTGQTQTGTLVSTGTSNLQGAVTLGSAGTGTSNAVRADRNVLAGNGVTGGGNLTSDKSITLGTPTTLTTATTNSVTASSHTHAVTFPVTAAGNGVTLSSGTLALGTPGTISTLTSNGVTASSHTHQITPGDSFLPFLQVGTNPGGVLTNMQHLVGTRSVFMIATRSGNCRIFLTEHRVSSTGNATSTYTIFKNGTQIKTNTTTSQANATEANRSVDTSMLQGDVFEVRQVVTGAVSGIVSGVQMRFSITGLRSPAYYSSYESDPRGVTI